MDSSFERADDGGTQVWLTPPDIIKDLGPFDLDPCACSEPRPWPTAAQHFTEADDGLSKPWHGFVWCNPPYSPSKLSGQFIARMAEHRNGLLLIFARTETDNWHRHIWPRADAVSFFEGRLTFFTPEGRPAVNAKTGKVQCAGAPSALIAYGPEAVRRLKAFKAKGHFQPLAPFAATDPLQLKLTA